MSDQQASDQEVLAQSAVVRRVPKKAATLPNDWRQTFIRDIADVVRGASPRPAGDPRYFEGDYLPWITVSEVTADESIYLTSTKTKLTEVGAGHTRIIEPGTLILTNSGATLGVPKITRIRAGANDGIAMLTKLQNVSALYLYYFLQSKTTYLRDVVAPGNGQPNLNTELIGAIALPLPPPEQQARIVKILETWDEAISSTESLLANSREQKRALLERLISKTDALELVRLDSISKRVKRESDGGNHPVLMISASTGFVLQSDMYSRFMAGKSLDDYILLKQGEFAYNKGNSKSYEFGCIYPLEDFPQGLVPHVYVCFEMDEGRCFRPFYKYLFEADYLHDQLGALVNTGVRNNGLLNIRPADFLGTQVPVPPMEEQHRIAAILDASTKSIRTLEDYLLRLKTEKAALMQQLLSGRHSVRTSVPGKVA